IVTSGMWDPRPESEVPGEIDEVDERAEALRHGGRTELVQRFKVDLGGTFALEFPSWAQSVTLRSDPEALLAARRLRWTWNGIAEEELRSFAVPARSA